MMTRRPHLFIALVLLFALLSFAFPVRAAETVTASECKCADVWGVSFVGDANIESELSSALSGNPFCTENASVCTEYCNLLRSEYEGIDSESLVDFPAPPVVACESIITNITKEDCATERLKDHPDCKQFETQRTSNLPISVPELEIPIPFVDFSEALSTPSANEVIAPWIGEYVAGVYRFLLSIVGVIAGVFLIIGGYAYLTAGGSAERAQKGKRRIINAITGLILAFGSYVILYSINPGLVNFEALRLDVVKTELFETDKENATNEGGLIEATEKTPDKSFPGGKPKSICHSLKACQAYCPPAKKKPPSPDSIGMADKADTEVIGNHPGLIGGGHRTLKGTKTLLIKAGAIADAKGYFILVASAFRELDRQVKLICGAYKGDLKRIAEGKRKKSGRTIAWPGSSFHGVGYALDLQLWKKGSLVERKGKMVVPGKCRNNYPACVSTSGASDGQNDKKWTKGAKTLADIMFSAGFRRLNNEIWHFEPKNAPASGCRCETLSDCSFPPHVSC